MKPQSCKAKGKRLQNKIVSDLLSAFPSLEVDDIKSTPSGINGEDVQLSPAAQRLIPYSFEAKNQERLNIWGAIEQNHTNCNGRIPVTVIKKNHTNTYAVVPWDTFLKLLVGSKSDPCEYELSEAQKQELKDIADRLCQLTSTIA